MGASLVPRTDGVMEAHSGSLVCRSRAGGAGTSHMFVAGYMYRVQYSLARDGRARLGS